MCENLSFGEPLPNVIQDLGFIEYSHFAHIIDVTGANEIEGILLINLVHFAII